MRFGESTRRVKSTFLLIDLVIYSLTSSPIQSFPNSLFIKYSRLIYKRFVYHQRKQQQ